MAERSFDYRPKWTTVVLGIMFFGACAAVFALKAHSNTKGLIVNSLLSLGTRHASLFFWCISGLSLTLAMAAVLLAVVRLSIHQRITIGTECIVLPVSRFSSKTISVEYSAIRDMPVSTVRKIRFVKIVHASGSFTVADSMLPEKADFDELVRLLNERLQ